MMKKSFFPIAAIAMAMTACSSDEPLTNSAHETAQVNGNPFRITIKDALKAAAQTREEFFGLSTRSVSNPDVKTVYATAGTRSEGEPMYYIINYGDDNGFAVASADSRVETIQAISDEGRLQMEDTVNNKGLAMFFSDLNAQYSGYNPYYPNNPKDTTIQIIPTIPTVKTEKVGPLLSKAVRQWHQDIPFNSFCPSPEDNKYIHYKTGCTPLATAQILSYFRWPEKVGNTVVNWDAVNNSTQNPYTYQLLADLGSPQYLNSIYGISETLTYADSTLIPTFSKLGYRINYVNLSFNPGYIHFNNGPVIIRSAKVNTNDRHAWVADGSIDTEREVPDPVTGGMKTSYSHYIHCVWGQGGLGDGFFLYNGLYQNTQLGGTPSQRDENDGTGSFPKQNMFRVYGSFEKTSN